MHIPQLNKKNHHIIKYHTKYITKDDATLDKLQSKIIEFYKMLDVIRVRKKTDFNVETLKNALNVSRTTADRFVNELLGENIIRKEEKRYIIDGNIAFFLGISIGSEHTRLYLIDLNFEPLSRDTIKQYPCLAEIETFGDFVDSESKDNGFCFKTPAAGDNNTFSQVHDFLAKIIAAFLQQVEQSQIDDMLHFPLAGIGIAVTGPVDYAKAIWCSAPEQLTKIRKISLPELIGYDNLRKAESLDVFLSLDNNAKTAMISEYQYLLERKSGNFNEDIALLYIGSGIGSSAVLGRTLLRGSRNLSGEIGSLPTLPTFTKNDKGELIQSGLQKTVDEQIRSLQLSTNTDENLKSYFCILTYLCNVINCILGIDRVILVGHSIRKHENIIPSLLEKRMEYTIASTQHFCKPEKGRGIGGTAAIGAAIESYMSMCHFDSSSPEERTNLAKDICWA